MKNMKKLKLLAAALICACTTTVIAGLSTHDFGIIPAAASSHITGEYVEARTASVFCGACHGFCGQRFGQRRIRRFRIAQFSSQEDSRSYTRSRTCASRRGDCAQRERQCAGARVPGRD